MTHRGKFKIIGRQDGVQVVSGYIVTIELSNGFSRDFGVHKVGSNLWQLTDIESGLTLSYCKSKWMCIDHVYFKAEMVQSVFTDPIERAKYQWAIDKINNYEGDN